MYKCVTTQVDSSLTDLYPGSWAPSCVDLCHFKVSVLVPLEWGLQMLSCFGFSTYPHTFHMCSPLVKWPKSNNIAVFALDLKTTYEGEHMIFVFWAWLTSLTWCSLVLSIYLQMIRFHYSSQLSKISLCINTIFSWSICQYWGILAVSIT
jgi:hypothetical protein